MKNIQDFIFRIKDLGVTISLQDEDIKIVAPKNVLTPDIVNELKELKGDIINFLKKTTSDGLYESYTLLKPTVIKDSYPLSSVQKRLYLMQQMDLGSVAYNVPYTISLGRGVDRVKVEEIFLQLITRHESLRTSFEEQGEGPVQRIAGSVEFRVEELTVDRSDLQGVQDRFVRVFDLTRAPLLRVAIVDVAGGDRLLLIDMHHIITDGVSIGILEREFHQLSQGQALMPLSLQYKDYSEWQNSPEQRDRAKEQEGYWLAQLAGEVPVLNLPADYPRPAIQSYEGANVSFSLSREETEGLRALAKASDITLYMSVLSAFSILLSKLSGQEDIIIGTPIAGRRHPDLEGIVGMFVNTLVIRSRVEERESVGGFLQKLKRTTLDAYEHQDYQFEDLVDKVTFSRDSSRNPLFDVAFNLLNQMEHKSDISSLSHEAFTHSAGVSKFDLTLTAADCGDQLLLSFEYGTRLFRPETIERFIAYFKRIVAQVVKGQGLSLSEVELISAAEKAQLLYGFNSTGADYPGDRSLKALLEELSARFPDSVAISSGPNQISYNALNERSNQLARRIVERGVRPGDVVALIAERSERLIIAMLGIVKAGATYLPIDSTWPEERIRFMLSDTGCPLLLCEQGLTGLSGVDTERLEISDPAHYADEAGNLELSVESVCPLYIIYTSGTTGKPKGVIVNHRNVSRVALNNGYLSVERSDKILQLSNYSFDGSVFDIYGALLNGASLVMIDTYSLLDIGVLLGTISRKQVSIFFLTTALFNTIVDFGMNLLKDVRRILFGGEQISKPHTTRALSHLGSGRLIHVYGPTETTVFASYYNIDGVDDDRESIPIGRPISNTTIYLLDRGRRLTPKGVVGEVYIGGAGNSIGYLNGVELTSERFVRNPYRTDELLYKTGDLGRMLPSGDIEFSGRIDHQVKIRGFRIELGEIESALLGYESIKEAMVIAIGENQEKMLTAYIVCKEDFREGALRDHLAKGLPDYMIPTHFIKMDAFPLNTNGKVNRKALPAPEVKSDADYVAPSGEIERKLVDVWSGVLGIPAGEISVTANFFNIGGHSLKAMALIGKIHKECNVKMSLIEIFKKPTIQELASFIDVISKYKKVQQSSNVEKERIVL